MKCDPSNTDVTLVQPSPECCFETTIKRTNQPVNYSPSQMKPSSTSALSTTVQPGRPKKRGKMAIIL
jgi:hypothetical protein